MLRIVILLLLLVTSAYGADIKPVMIYDSDVIMDKSWNEALHTGITQFEKKLNIDVEEVSILDVVSFEKKATEFAKNGYNPIMTPNLDAEHERVVKKIMYDHPHIRFIIFNGIYNLPNAYYFIFSSQESSFLAGYLASRKSKTKKLAFIGGMELPLIRNFLCGYIKGAKYENPKTEVVYQFISNDFSAWNSPDKAFAIATEQIKGGADVIFSPSGGSAEGALKAAHENGVYGIGVDKNQNHLFPGSILTSTMVRVDNAVFRALFAAQRGVWGEQKKIMGLQEKGVELAFDKYNAPLVSNELQGELKKIEADIVLGKVDLPNYSFTNECIVDGEKLF